MIWGFMPNASVRTLRGKMFELFTQYCVVFLYDFSFQVESIVVKVRGGLILNIVFFGSFSYCEDSSRE